MRRRSPGSFRRVPRGVSRPSFALLVLIGATIALAVGIASIAAGFRPFSLSSVVLLAIAVGSLAVLLLIARPTLSPTLILSGDPRSESERAPRTAESAFVCAKCESYTPAPDWEGLLREFDAPADLEGHRGSKPSMLPVAAPADPIWPRWPPNIVAPGFAEAVPTGPTSPDESGPWVPLPAAYERDPELIFSEAEVEPIAASGGPLSISGGRLSRTIPRPVAVVIPPEPGTGRPIAPGDAPVAPSLSIVAAIGGGAARSPLHQWIAAESVELVSLSGTNPLRTAEPVPGIAESPEGSPGPRPRPRVCAACRKSTEEMAHSAVCADCQRPICGPCRSTAVTHRGQLYCSPCAVNRLGSDLLETLEEPSRPAHDDRGIGPVLPARRPRRPVARAKGRPKSARAQRPVDADPLSPPSPAPTVLAAIPSAPDDPPEGYG